MTTAATRVGTFAAQNDIARATIAQLQANFEQIDALRDEIVDLRAEFPTQAKYDSAVEELLTGLLTNGLTLQNFSINEPSPTSALALGDGEDAPEPGVDGDGLLPTGTLLRVPVSVTVTGPLTSLLAYIDSLQQSTRFAIISSGAASGGTSADGSTMTFAMVIYVVTGADLTNVPVAEGETRADGEGESGGETEGEPIDPADPDETEESEESSP